MGGKASLLLVLAFGTLFGIIGTQILRTTNEATDAYVDYFKKTKAHDLAVSGANMAANETYMNPWWKSGYSNLSIEGGTVDVSVDSLVGNRRMLASVSNYAGYKDTVIVWLEPKNFAQYGNFYDLMAAWAATGDTFSGPFHTNDVLKCYGDPVFLGYTTTQKGVKLNDTKSHPEFHGGLQSGVYVPLEFDTSMVMNAARTGGKIFRDPSGKKIIDVQLTLNNDGTVTYSQRIGGGAWTAPQTTPITTLAPNGVIAADMGNFYVKGTLSGRLSIVAMKQKTNGAGIVHIVDDIVYNKDPRKDASSTDMLGIIAQDYVQVDFNDTRGDLDVQASIYSQGDGILIENYQKYPAAYMMNIYGGVIGKRVLPTAEYVWDGKKYVPVHGYSYVHRFDERFNVTVPPYFPLTKLYRIVAWQE
jgi:hypothetical protein